MNRKINWLMALTLISVIFVSINTGFVTGSDTGSDEVIRGYYVWVTDVRTLGDVVLGQNITIEVDVMYNFLEVPLVPTIVDDNYEVRGKTSDIIQGYGNKTYTISMKTKQNDDEAVFAVVGYYYIDGNWTYMAPNGYMAFTLGQSGATVDTDTSDFSDLDMEEISNMLNDTIQKGLEYLDDVDISSIEESIKEQTGIPGYPIEALIIGAAAVVYGARRRI